MNLLMITWTDLFEATGTFFYWIFDIMRTMGQKPNIIMGAFIVSLLGLWCYRIIQQKKKADQDGTYF